MSLALVAVDVQWDFIDGSLGAPGREEVIAEILKLAPLTDFVVASQDWHPPNHCSFETWGEHCVKDTHGAELHPEIEALAAFTVKKAMFADKEALSAFDGTFLDSMLTRERIRTLIFCGFCTDYCVLATVLDAIKLGYRAVVALPACRGADRNSIREAVAQMEEAGATILRG